MGIVEKTRAAAPATTADFERFRLRRFVEGLAEELETVHEATDLADVARILEGNAKAVLLRAVGPERQELVGNVTGTEKSLIMGRSMTSPRFHIRPATSTDAPLLLELITELAEFEKLADQVVATEAQLRQTLFGPRPYAEAVIAEDEVIAVGDRRDDTVGTVAGAWTS